MSFRFWKPSPTPRSVEIIRRDSLKLKLSEWRGDSKLVSEAAKVLSLETVRCMLDVLRNENPANYVMPFGTSQEDRLASQCRAEGYTMALSNLEALGQGQNMPEALEATFEAEETKQL